MQYGQLGNITSAAEASGVARRSHYNWYDTDALGYRARFEAARDRYADRIEQMVHDRLTDPTGNRGSDILLMFDLKSVRPEKYREAAVVADDAAKDTLAYLKKMRQEELREEKRAAEGSGGKELGVGVTCWSNGRMAQGYGVLGRGHP